ncbi:hypothetical protein QTO34_005626 [Cnephaeus nilssonii]|uniref:Homeobox domain-containing protein n=1 Tax=Cnephaeus nilssonii TaxID=3371016 RepID=A0AA40LK35_CNENI|nr:hypothetical protein QTO34_005626 [Eptesicus nilssonii]
MYSRGPQGGPRPKRTRYNKNQLKVLIEAFEKEPYLDVSTRQELARRIQIPESRIQPLARRLMKGVEGLGLLEKE